MGTNVSKARPAGTSPQQGMHTHFDSQTKIIPDMKRPRGRFQAKQRLNIDSLHIYRYHNHQNISTTLCFGEKCVQNCLRKTAVVVAERGNRTPPRSKNRKKKLSRPVFRFPSVLSPPWLYETPTCCVIQWKGPSTSQASHKKLPSGLMKTCCELTPRPTMFRRQCLIPEAQTVRSTSIGKQSQLPASSEDACLPLEPGRVLVELNAAVEGRRPEETPD